MSPTDIPDEPPGAPVQATAHAQSVWLAWAGTALMIIATTTAILLVSFVAVVAGLA